MNSSFYTPASETATSDTDIYRTSEHHKSMSPEEKLALIQSSFRNTVVSKNTPPPLHSSATETATFLDPSTRKAAVSRTAASEPGQISANLAANENIASQHLTRRQVDPTTQLKSVEAAFRRSTVDPIREAQEQNKMMELQAALHQQRLQMQAESEQQSQKMIKYVIVGAGVGVVLYLGYKFWSYTSEISALKARTEIMQNMLHQAQENFQG